MVARHGARPRRRREAGARRTGRKRTELALSERPNEPVQLDIHQILAILPHRYPFVMVDRVTEIVAGKSIRGLWKGLEQVLNIPRDAQVSVNGERADDDYIVRPGDEIEFQKAAGVKGQAA